MNTKNLKGNLRVNLKGTMKQFSNQAGKWLRQFSNLAGKWWKRFTEKDLEKAGTKLDRLFRFLQKKSGYALQQAGTAMIRRSK